MRSRAFPTQTTSPVLTLTDVHSYYGSSHVLQGVSLEVREREVVCLLGRNGAGKTTTLRTVMGILRARAGSISFDGGEIVDQATYAIARAGIGYVPSGRRLFAGLTVRQNLLLSQRRAGSAAAWNIERVYDVFPKLAETDGRQAQYLSGGEQQMLKLARALVGNPRLLLLDEPTEGLAPIVVRSLGDWLRQLQAAGMPILLCEQNSAFALAVADRGYILEKGSIRAEGMAESLRGSAELLAHAGIGRLAR